MPFRSRSKRVQRNGANTVENEKERNMAVSLSCAQKMTNCSNSAIDLNEDVQQQTQHLAQ